MCSTAFSGCSGRVPPGPTCPSAIPPYQTCHRRFQHWARGGTLHRVLQMLAADLAARGGLDVSEAFIDGTFAGAKKGARAYRPSPLKPRCCVRCLGEPTSGAKFTHPGEIERGLGAADCTGARRRTGGRLDWRLRYLHSLLVSLYVVF